MYRMEKKIHRTQVPHYEYNIRYLEETIFILQRLRVSSRDTNTSTRFDLMVSHRAIVCRTRQQESAK